jgi:DNA replication licensing factor MCM7
LSTFKESASASETAATSALENLNINEDDISDDYDFMEDAEDESNGTRRGRGARNRDPKKKYMEILQKIADRQLSEICIELDDLDTVCYHAMAAHALS